jgi:Family of unknown function (DUF6236)
METALYFPYIRVPESAWFTQVLLYWDGAASIIPRQMRNDMTGLGKYMNELIGAGLLRPIDPDYAIKGGQREFDDRFLTLLETHKFPKICKPGLTRAGRKTLSHPERWTRIHKDKVSFGLVDELNSRGLACSLGDFPTSAVRADPNHSSWWWAFESKVAELYMLYITGSLCRNDESLFPVTDTESSLQALVEPISADASSRLRVLTYSTITQALPAPSRLVPPDEIASFKDRHGDQLRRLRQSLNGKLADLAAIDDDFLRDTKTESFIQEIQDDVAVLVEQMEKRRWPRIVFVGVGGFVASAAALGLTIASGGTALAVGLGITGGIASLGPVGYQAADLFRSPRFDEHSPMAYAALAQAL